MPVYYIPLKKYTVATGYPESLEIGKTSYIKQPFNVYYPYIFAIKMEHPKNCNINATSIQEVMKWLKERDFNAVNIREELENSYYSSPSITAS